MSSTLFPESPYQQQFDLFKLVLGLRKDTPAEWLLVLDLMRELVELETKILYGEPHWKTKFLKVTTQMRNILREWDVQSEVTVPSFTIGGAA